MRDPAIHVTWSKMTEVLGKYKLTPKEISEILGELHAFGISSRFLFVDQKANKKTESRIIGKVNLVLDHLRRKYHHKHVFPIVPGSKEWDLLNTLSKVIEEMITNYKIDDITAVKFYIEFTLKNLGHRYELRKLINYKSQVFKKYEEQLAIQQDPTPELSQAIYHYYNTKVGGVCEFSAQFVYTAEQIYSTPGVDYKKWIDAQFKGFFESIPQPYQLYGPNALIRYNNTITGIKRSAIQEAARNKLKQVK